MTGQFSNRAWSFLASLILVSGCAATGASLDDNYRQGVERFDSCRWNEARVSLRPFVALNCTKRARADCDRAIWMLMQSDLRMGVPAQALVDYYFAEATATTSPGLEPSLAVLRQQAAQALRVAWDGGDRSVAMQIVTANEVGQPFRPKRLDYALDTGPPVSAIAEGDPLRTRPLDFSAPAGSHLLALAADYSNGDTIVHLRSQKAFTVSPGEKVRATVTIRNDAGIGMRVEFSGVSSPLAAMGPQCDVQLGFAEPSPATERPGRF